MHNVATIQRSVFCGGGARCASHRKERRAASQAVVLPLRYGLSLSQTAEALGISATWASRLRNAFLDGRSVGDGSVPSRGGRHRENFTREREAELLKPFIERALNTEMTLIQSALANRACEGQESLLHGFREGSTVLL